MGAVLDLRREHSNEFHNTIDATNNQQLLHNTTRIHELQSQVAKLSQRISEMAEETQKGPVKMWFKELWADVKAVCCKPTHQDQITTQLKMRDGLNPEKLSHRLRAFFEKAPIQRMAVAAALVLACIAGYKLFGTGLLVAGSIGLAVAGIGFASKHFNNSTQENTTNSSSRSAEAVVENNHQQQSSTTTA